VLLFFVAIASAGLLIALMVAGTPLILLGCLLASIKVVEVVTARLPGRRSP